MLSRYLSKLDFNDKASSFFIIDLSVQFLLTSQHPALHAVVQLVLVELTTISSYQKVLVSPPYDSQPK